MSKQRVRRESTVPSIAPPLCFRIPLFCTLTGLQRPPRTKVSRKEKGPGPAFGRPTRIKYIPQ
jgi:hypothetical protein